MNEPRAFRAHPVAARGTPPKTGLSMRAAMSNCRTDAALRRDLFSAAERDRTNTADFLALIADFDARRLYVPEGYASMHAFCVGALRMCEGSAFKRIQAARAVWKFPQLCTALAEGRLHLTAVFTLAPHLTAENVDELVTACTHKTRRNIQDLIARRFLGRAAGLPFDPLPVAPADPEGPPADGQLVPVPVDPHPLKIAQASVVQPVDPP